MMHFWCQSPAQLIFHPCIPTGVALTIDLSAEIAPNAGNVLQDRVSPRAAVENVDIRHTQGEFGGGWIGGVYLHNALHVTLNRSETALHACYGALWAPLIANLHWA